MPAIAVAWLLARGRFWGRSVLNVLVHLPLVVPPVVTGYFLLRIFGRRGPLGAWLEQMLGLVPFRWTGAALAAAVMGFPLVVRAIRLGIESVDRQTEEAAATLGASPAWTFATITLPLALPGRARGPRARVRQALGEFGATITFVSNIPGRDAHARAGDLHRARQARRRRGRRCGWPGSRSPSPLGALAIVGVAQPLREARSSMSLVVEIEHDFGGLRLDVALSLDSRLTAIVGPSGSGKTTILNVIAGVLRPDRALVRIDGEVVADTAAGVWRPPHQRGIGYVFQEPRLFPHLTVRQNLMFGRWFSRQSAGGIDSAEVIDLLNLGALLARRPSRLSGGEKQRVALGRALLAKPRSS